MSIFKCKMCGGTLEINNNESVGTCEYCGTQQTLPKLDDDRKANLYDRANHFRRNNEFDKAMGIYEQILNEDKTDSEAYWSLVLCHYGIEYVEDPSSHKRIPTVNRAQYTSIFNDDNYKSALQYADIMQKTIYENEAKAINEIQKGILEISQKEEPFDVFICYKETDNNGRRTPDSVLANDLYHQLTQEGFKVFFARITLEDKLGSAYEPYIFAALNSSKVMVVMGTKPEYFNAVWVKNEWSRYLALIKNGEKKMLIPAYKDMDPYDLPEEFSHLQAQDMTKLGFMQDLIRGIKKITAVDEPKQTVVKETVVTSTNSSTEPLLKRAYMFLEDGDWGSANEYCEKVLDIDPENAKAYLGKLMAEKNVRNQEDLKNLELPFDNSNNYQKAVRFGDENLKSTLTGYVDYIVERNEETRRNEIYNEAVSKMKEAKEVHDYRYYYKSIELFDSIIDYRDSAELKNQCVEQREVERKDEIYRNAVARMSGDRIDFYEEAIIKFESIIDWKESRRHIEKCKERIEVLKEEEKKREEERQKRLELQRIEDERIRKRYIKITKISSIVILIALVIVFVAINFIIPNVKYRMAVSLMDEGKYTEAISAFKEMDGYKDSVNKIEECNTAILDGKYNDAVALMGAGNLDEAYSIFIELGDYKDAADKADDIRLTKTDIRLTKTKEQLKGVKVGDYITFGAYEQDNNTSNGKEDIEWLVLEVKDGKALVISKYALDCKPYNTEYTHVTWETCTLRKWLNNDFLGAAFSADEKAMIPTVTVSADRNPEYSTNPGNATQDQVFLLSITEANQYFSSKSARQCKSTDYAVANGGYANSDNGYCQWWLRSPGDRQEEAAGVYIFGDVIKHGYVVDNGISVVRPALWIELGQ